MTKVIRASLLFWKSVRTYARLVANVKDTRCRRCFRLALLITVPGAGAGDVKSSTKLTNATWDISAMLPNSKDRRPLHRCPAPSETASSRLKNIDMREGTWPMRRLRNFDEDSVGRLPLPCDDW